MADDDHLVEVARPADRLQDAEQGLVDDDRPVLSVVDDVGELIGMQARVEGVDDRAHCRDTEVHREVLGLVPEQGRDAVSGFDSPIAEPSGQAPGLLGNRGVGRPVQPPVGRRETISRSG